MPGVLVREDDCELGNRFRSAVSSCCNRTFSISWRSIALSFCRTFKRSAASSPRAEWQASTRAKQPSKSFFIDAPIILRTRNKPERTLVDPQKLCRIYKYRIEMAVSQNTRRGIIGSNPQEYRDTTS